MLRKLVSTSSVRLFNPQKRTPCYGGPTAEMEARESKLRAQAAKKQRAQEILLCKLGAFAYSLNDETLKLLKPNQLQLLAEVKQFHKEHRLDEHNHLQKIIRERVEQLDKEIRHQERFERESVKDVMIIKYEEYFKLKEELKKLESTDTNSNQFLIEREKEEEVFNKLKL